MKIEIEIDYIGKDSYAGLIRVNGKIVECHTYESRTDAVTGLKEELNAIMRNIVGKGLSYD